MMDSRRIDPVTRAIGAIGARGRIGRELAVRLDALRSTGPRYALLRLREDARLRALARNDLAGPVYRAIWLDAANELAAEVVDLSDGFLEIRRSETSTRVWNHWVMLDTAVMLQLALSKPLVHRLLSSAELHVPEHLEFDSSDIRPAVDFIQRYSTPCVIKPVASSGGWGVTSGVRSPSELMRASLRASRTDTRLVIERQAAGHFYRFLFLDGKLLDVVRRRPPRVTGNGRSSIAELIAAENRRRIDRRRDVLLSHLRVDLDCILTLESAGLSVDSVLPGGVTVPVKTVVSQNTLEDNETVREAIADELVAEAAAAARVVGLRLAGVDVMTTDLGKPLQESGGVIIEVNGTPGLAYHYEVADRANCTRVAVPILQKLLS
jgi:D-alanine-D-alanine ligase-like ATP-grasp enzyme